MATNEELAARWRAGDREAFELLHAQNRGLLVRARMIFGRECGREESESLALGALLEAANRHDETRGKFSTCYMLCARTAFAHVRNYEAAAKRSAVVFSLGAGPTMKRWEGIRDVSAENPAKIVEREDERRHQLAIVRRRMRRLNERDRDIVKRRAAGESLRTIAIDYGVCNERIRMLADRAMGWLRMSDEEFAAERKINRALGGDARKAVTA